MMSVCAVSPPTSPRAIPFADVDGHAALQVRQPEGLPAVAAVGRSENREQGLVLVDRQQLTIARTSSPWAENSMR